MLSQKITSSDDTDSNAERRKLVTSTTESVSVSGKQSDTRNIQVSLDIETLGIRHEAPIIQIGAAIFDITDLPGVMINSMEFLVGNGPVLHEVEPYAAAMNYRILAALSGFKIDNPIECPIVLVDKAAEYLGQWLYKEFDTLGGFKGKIVFCGKNFSGFDRPKLERLPGWKSNIPPYHLRSPDPGSLWWRPEVDGDVLPSTKVCMERAGLGGTVAHTAEQDAIAVATLIQMYTHSAMEIL